MSLDELTSRIKEKVGANSGLDAKDADCTITISRANFEKLIAGDLDPTTAYMFGKIKVSGSMGVAMKLSKVL